MSAIWAGILVGASLMWLCCATLAYPCHVVLVQGVPYASCADRFAWRAR